MRGVFLMTVSEKSIMIQKILSVLLFAGSIIFYILAYVGKLVISPMWALNLIILTIGLFVLHWLRKEGKKIWEVFYFFSILNYFMLMIASFIYQVWTFEKIFTKLGITKLSLFLFFLVTIYLTIVYARVKTNYKTVKGNQRHNTTWRVNRKELKRIMDSDDIYINLGTYHERSDN